MNKRSVHVLLATMAASTALVPMAQASLLAHFKMEEGSLDPTTNMIHSVVSTNSGIFSNLTVYPAWITSELAPVPASQGGTTAALNFVHVSSDFTGYVLTDLMPPLSNAPRTFAAWVKASPSLIGAANANVGCIASYGNVNVGSARFTFKVDPAATSGGRLRFETQGAVVVGSTVVADDTWHHVAIVIPAGAYMSNVVMYVDGNPQTFTLNTVPGAAVATGTNTAATLYPLYIGSTINALNRSYWGAIDELKVYDEALTPSQIIELVYGSGTAPIISQHPVNAQAILGTTNASVSFNVSLSSGSPPLKYQWQQDGANLTNGTNQILTLSPVTAANIGVYRLAITNPFGYAISSPASLTWATPPVDPSEQTVLVGSNATFSLTMPADSSGYTYQWLKGGAEIPEATGAAYTVTNAQLADAGAYSVRVSLAGQMATSAPARLQVLGATNSLYANAVLAGPVAAYWRLGESYASPEQAADVTGLHTGAYSNFLYGLGYLGMPGAILNDPDTSVFFDGAANCVEVPYSPALQHSSAFTLEAWVQTLRSSGSVICSRSQYLSRGYELSFSGGAWQFRSGASYTTAAEAWDDLNGGVVKQSQWQHVVATYDGTTKKLYVDGELVGTQTVPVLPVALPLRIGADQTYSSIPGNYLTGDIDEVAIYWQALTAEQVAEHYSIGAFGVAKIAPSFLTVPVASTNYAGANVGFVSAAQGTPPLAYQWLKNGTNLPGATNSILLLSRITAADQGSYAVSVSNGTGSTNSPAATLTVVPVTLTGYPGAVLSDGPVAYFPLDDPLGTGIAAEICSFGAYQGTYNNAPTQQQPGATPSTGRSVNFDGVNQSITFDNYPALNFAGQVTLEAWVKPAQTFASGYGNIIAHGYAGNPKRELVLRISSTNYSISSSVGVSGGSASFPVPSSDVGTWVHIVGTYDGTAWNLYRNGALSARSVSAGGAVTVDAGWAIGANAANSGRFFQGNIDEPAIYNYALSPAQVARHYFAATGQTGSLNWSSSGGGLVLTWNAGQLEQAPSLEGPWTPLPGAMSPLTVPTTEPSMFYRLAW